MGFGVYVTSPGYIAIDIASIVSSEFDRGRDEEERDMETDGGNCTTDRNQDGSASSDSSIKWLTDSLVAVNSNPDREKQSSVESRPRCNDFNEACPRALIVKEDHDDLHPVDDAGDEIDNGKGDEGDVCSIFNTLTSKDDDDGYIAWNPDGSRQTTNSHSKYIEVGKHTEESQRDVCQKRTNQA